MPTLSVDQVFTKALPGLGEITPFRELSEKRITKATRRALRERYGLRRVEVSCGAELNGGQWWGRCSIDGRPLKYHISP